MFTGIVEEIGEIKAIHKAGNLICLDVKAKKVVRGAKNGDSISVNGVCLTLTKIKSNTLSFDVMKETIKCTTLGRLNAKAKVNLEGALKANSRLGGHFVTGHIDEVGKVKAVIKDKDYIEIRIAISKKMLKYIVPKGSVCVNGVSLTVGKRKQNIFSVYLIPFTLEVTNLGNIKKNDTVNIETDILAKYVLNK